MENSLQQAINNAPIVMLEGITIKNKNKNLSRIEHIDLGEVEFDDWDGKTLFLKYKTKQ